MPPRTSYYHIEANCPSECTSKWPNDITVFADGLHMHQVGKMMWSVHYDSTGTRVSENNGYLNRVEYWDFKFQDFPRFKTVIKRGDRINTHCVFDTSTINRTVKFGSASSDEMCLEFVAYYPRLTIVKDGKTTLYTVCGKRSGRYDKDQNKIPNPPDGSQFSTICGDRQFPDTYEWNAENITLKNPTISDPPGDGERSFGVVPSSCSAQPPSGWPAWVVIALGATCGVLFIAMLIVLFSRVSCSAHNQYEVIDGNDEMDNRK